MNWRSAAAALVIFAGTSLFAQQTAPVPTPAANTMPTQRRLPPGRWGSGAAGRPAPMPGSLALHQRVQDMETTVTNMHAALKRMQAKAAVAKSKDPLVKANLDMWTLMVDHLDKQLQELKLAEAERQDLEARRAAMYRQADAKADAEARAAQSAQAAKAAEAARSAAGAQAGSPGAQPAGQNAAPAAQPPAPPASTSPSPK